MTLDCIARTIRSSTIQIENIMDDIHLIIRCLNHGSERLGLERSLTHLNNIKKELEKITDYK